MPPADVEEPAGPIEVKVQQDITALITQHPMAEGLRAMAVNLARALDGGAGLATAAINRELRETLGELARMGVTGDDLGDQLSTPTGGAEPDVPAEVRDPEDT